MNDTAGKFICKSFLEFYLSSLHHQIFDIHLIATRNAIDILNSVLRNVANIFFGNTKDGALPDQNMLCMYILLYTHLVFTIETF